MLKIRRPGRSAPYDRDVLRQRRCDAGLSQRALAALAEVSPSAISCLESGKHGASAATLKRIADALGCTPGDLRAATEQEAR